jgi:hypothetical protein
MLDEGGSLSIFGVETGHDGAALRTQLAYGTTGMTLDFIVEQGLIPQPLTMIKIEVNEGYQILAMEVQELLCAAGLTSVERRHSDMLAGDALRTPTTRSGCEIR